MRKVALTDLLHLLLLLQLLLHDVWINVRHSVSIWSTHAWATLGHIHHRTLATLRTSHSVHLLRQGTWLSTGHALTRRMPRSHRVSSRCHTAMAGHGARVERLRNTRHYDLDLGHCLRLLDLE